jgi:hypothetical protein
MQPTNGAKRPEEGGVGAEGMEEAGADKSRVADFSRSRYRTLSSEMPIYFCFNWYGRTNR